MRGGHFGRPAGTYGEVGRALLRAAEHGPGSYRDLATRAQVGFDLARKTASRMCSRGELVVLDGGQRPAVLALPSATPVQPAGEGLGAALDALHRSFWDIGVSEADVSG